MNISSYDLIPVEELTTIKNYANLGESAGNLVIGAVNMLPIQTVTLATEQTVAGYTFTTAGQVASTTSFMSAVSSVVSALSIIGTIVAIALTINSYLSAMWAVDSIKRQRDKVLTMFRKIKRLNRIADINKIVYGNMQQYLQQQYNMLSQYETVLNDNNLIVKDFFGSKTNTYLLSNPLITYLQNEQNVLNIIKANNYKYINVVPFIEYVKNTNILELDKIRIANADTNTLKTYIDNLNATLVMIDKLETLNLFEQTIKDINFIKNNVNILLNEIKKTYVEQLDNQNINNPLQMLEEITTDIPFLDLSAQTKDIGGLSLYPTEYIVNDIPILFNKINKKDLMILVFNNIYITKFISLMISYYQTQKEMSADIKKYIDSSVNTYNLLNQIIGLKILKEKNYNQVLPDNVNVEKYRIYTYLKKLFIKKTQTFLKKYSFSYKKANNVNVSNSIILSDLIYNLEDYFYKNDKKYDIENFLFFFNFNTNKEDEIIDNIDIDTIKINNFQNDYFDYIDDIRQTLLEYGTDIVHITKEDYSNLIVKTFKEGTLSDFFNVLSSKGDIEYSITNFKEFILYFVYVLAKIQIEINDNYEKCKYKSYVYNYNTLIFNDKLTEETKTDTIRIKDCIFVDNIIDKKIEELESKLYELRYDYKYEYSVFKDLFLSEQSYFLFELFTKIEQITNSSIGIINSIDLSVNNAGYNINFYEILFDFFTKYMNNYTGYIYSKNNYLNTLTTIAQTNFVSVLQIATDYKPINVKIENFKLSIDEISVKEVSQTQLRDIINIADDIETADILSNQDIVKPNIQNNSFGKIATTIIGVALLSN